MKFVLGGTMPRFVPEDWKDLPRGTIFEVLDLTEKDVPWFVGTVLIPEPAPGWGYRIGVSSQYIFTPGRWGLRIQEDGTLGWVDLDTLYIPSPVTVRVFDEHGDGTPMKPWQVRPGQLLEVHYGQGTNTLELWVELGPKLDAQNVPLDEAEGRPASELTEDQIADLIRKDAENTDTLTREHAENMALFGNRPAPPWAVAYAQVRSRVLTLMRRWDEEDDDAPLDLFRLGFEMGQSYPQGDNPPKGDAF